jgi:hypothetical protein
MNYNNASADRFGIHSFEINNFGVPGGMVERVINKNLKIWTYLDRMFISLGRQYR